MAFDIVLRDNGSGSFDISLGVATDNINPTLTTNTPTVLSPAIEGTITPDVTTNTPSVLSPLIEGYLEPGLTTNTPSVLSPAIEGTITPGVTTVTRTVYSPTLTDPTANPIVGYGTNSGGYSPTACYGVSPTTPLYHHPSDNAQAGMVMVGKKLYSDAAGTTPVGTANTWWSFHTIGGPADRAVSIGGDGTVANITFRNGITFGYANQGGDCNSTSFPIAANNAPDDYQFFYPRKAFARSTDQGFFFADGQWAFAYSSSGPPIGYATMAMELNYQNTYLSMTSCGSVRTKRHFFFIFE